MQGSALAIVLAALAVIWSGMLIAWAAEGAIGPRRIGTAMQAVLLTAALLAGSATIWLGPESLPISGSRF